MKQIVIPHKVGMIIAKNVHFQLFVSFFIVKQVVEQGKCIKQKIIVQSAVNQVQPLLISNVFKVFKLS